MVHELREYHFLQPNWDRYWDLFTGVCMPLRGTEFGVLRGAWIERHEGRVTFRHLWEYASLDHRAERRVALSAKPAWREDFIANATRLIDGQTLSMLSPKRVTLCRSNAGRTVQLFRFYCKVGAVGKLLERLEASGPAGWSTWSMEFPDPNGVIAIGETVSPDVPAAISTGLARVEVAAIEGVNVPSV
ncbi:NIPSNAP family protein [Cupriavidus sp. 2TAF22]|uniref:NIPSNAP family protein n=1 Tax=unclassified Cupriavidus TaxID=2640874 RepID=UPI003F8DE051